MYLEFLLLLIDYFKTLTKRVFIFEWLVPLVFVLVVHTFNKNTELSVFKAFKESSINILGVLLGFSIAIITIITTGSGSNLDNIKSKATNFKINQKNVSLYDLILINFTYSVVAEIFIIVFSLIAPIIGSIILLSASVKSYGYLVLVFGVIHILLLTLRNLTDFYLIISKK